MYNVILYCQGSGIKNGEKTLFVSLVIATNEMSKNIRQLLNEISFVSGSIASQSEELAQSSNEVNADAQQIATTMQELAAGTESQASSASESASVMGTFARVGLK